MSRRLVLRVAAKLLGLVALAALTFAFIASLIPNRPTRQPCSVNVQGLAPNQMERARCFGQRLLVLRRSDAVVRGLPQLAPALADPLSRDSTQPPGMATTTRSADQAIFVALDYDPDFGCPLDYVGPAGATPYHPWLGGFHAPCSDSWFDAAGRVYRHQRTLHNLRIPPYRLAGGQVVVKP